MKYFWLIVFIITHIVCGYTCAAHRADSLAQEIVNNLHQQQIEHINQQKAPFNIQFNNFMNCNEFRMITSPIGNRKNIKRTSSGAASAQNIVVTSTPDTDDQSEGQEHNKDNDFATPKDHETTQCGSLDQKHEANISCANTTGLVDWPLFAGVVCATYQPFIASFIIAEVCVDTFSRTQKIHTNTGSCWSNVGHTLFSLRMFAPILAYAGIMYGAPEKTSDTFKQVAVSILAGLITSVGAENAYQVSKFHQQAARQQAQSQDWKAANSTWANQQTLAKYKELKKGSLAGFIYGPRPK
jgi:hypothetical protein